MVQNTVKVDKNGLIFLYNTTTGVPKNELILLNSQITLPDYFWMFFL